jgi:thymidylate kinase
MTTTSKQLTIFEGPDGAGKTTLAKAYAQQSGSTYTHMGPYKGASADKFLQACEEVSCFGQKMVLDRWAPSEVIYGHTFRPDDPNRVSLEDQAMLENLTREHGVRTVLVLCLPNHQTCLDNFRRRAADGKEMLETEKQFNEVYNGYKYLALFERLTSFSVIHYDYEVHQVKDIFKLIEVARGY